MSFSTQTDLEGLTIERSRILGPRRDVDGMFVRGVTEFCKVTIYPTSDITDQIVGIEHRPLIPEAWLDYIMSGHGSFDASDSYTFLEELNEAYMDDFAYNPVRADIYMLRDIHRPYKCTGSVGDVAGIPGDPIDSDF